MTLEIALEADEEWDSSVSWAPLVRKAVEAAIAQSAFPDLARSGRLIELSVRLTTDDQVRMLNAHWRGKDRPTNVLSFPMAEAYELSDVSFVNRELLLGDIVVARGICEREAEAKEVPLDHHATHLIVHGTLHLLGYDHQSEADAADMEAREVRALQALGMTNPYEFAA